MEKTCSFLEAVGGYHWNWNSVENEKFFFMHEPRIVLTDLL